MHHTRHLPRFGKAAGVLAAAVALTAPGLSACARGPGHFTFRADFSRTIGLYPGSYVRELGVGLGSVTNVVNESGFVEVTMTIKGNHPLPATATATIVGESVLGERYVQVGPPYQGGPKLAPGATIGLDRTSVPVETDDVLRSLQNFLGNVDPGSARDAVTNLAAILAGQGDKINQLIAHAAGTVSLLASKTDDLGQLVSTLAQLNAALDSRTNDISALIRDYASVSAIVAANNQQLGDAVTQLANATEQASDLLAPNLGGLTDDVAALASAGRTLDRNMDSLDTTIAATPALFAAAQRAYDPQHNWLPLNSQSDPGTTAAVLKARIRDTLASVCRRLQVKLGTPNPTLQTCGDPNSGFFDAVLGLGAAARPASSGPPATATAAWVAGLAAIPDGASSAAILSAAGARPAAGPAPATGATAANTAAASLPAAQPSTTASFPADPARLLPPRPALRSAPKGPSWLGHILSWPVHVIRSLW